MTTADLELLLTDRGLAALRTPIDDFVLEVENGPDVFECQIGPFSEYRRTLHVSPVPDDEVTDERRHAVSSHIEFRLAIPVFGPMFAGLVRGVILRRLDQMQQITNAESPEPENAEPEPGKDPTKLPWWSPPDRMDVRMSTVLGLLCGLAIVAGYLGVLLSQSMSFAADQFELDATAQGDALAVIRLAVVLSLVAVWLADRRGRRTMLVWSLRLGCVFALTTAFAPNIWAFGLSQTLARGMSTTAAVLLGIIAAEEMPKNSRAYAISVIGMSGALGAGIAVFQVPLADIGGEGGAGWRLLFLSSIPLYVLVHHLAKFLPESQRFVAALQTEDDDIRAHTPAARRSHRGRLLLLATSGMAGQVFFAPASQFQTEFLRTERGFSASRIAAFNILTNTPGGIGVVVGGKLADNVGRRKVGAIGLIGGVVGTVVMFNVTGMGMWGVSVLAALLGAATLPALGVYGPELFPTSLRAKANSILTVLGVMGSVAGLRLAGRMIDQDGFGSTMTWLALGPALAALLVLFFYPETAHKALEEINPEDAVLDLRQPGDPLR